MSLTRRTALAALIGASLPCNDAFAREQTFEPISDLGPNEAAIYVFRPSRMTGGAGAFHFTLDGGGDEYVLRNGRHIALRVSSGSHVLRQAPQESQFSLSTQMVDLHLSPVTVNTEPGRHYYVAFAGELNGVTIITTPGGSTARTSFHFVELMETDALPLIGRTRSAQ
jgi:hypothetical protein